MPKYIGLLPCDWRIRYLHSAIFHCWCATCCSILWIMGVFENTMGIFSSQNLLFACSFMSTAKTQSHSWSSWSSPLSRQLGFYHAPTPNETCRFALSLKPGVSAPAASRGITMTAWPLAVKDAPLFSLAVCFFSGDTCPSSPPQCQLLRQMSAN